MQARLIILVALALCLVSVSSIAASPSLMRKQRVQYRAAMQNVTDFISGLETYYNISAAECTAEFDYDIAIIDKIFNIITCIIICITLKAILGA